MKGYCKHCDKEVKNMYSHRQSKKHQKNAPHDIIVKKAKLSDAEKAKKAKETFKKYYEKRRGERYTCEVCNKEMYESRRVAHEQTKMHKMNVIVENATKKLNEDSEEEKKKTKKRVKRKIAKKKADSDSE